MATSNYNLDINKQAIIKPLVILRQGDYGMDTMRVSLSVANEAMDLTGATVKFMGTTAGGHQIIDGAHVKIIDVTGGVFEYVFPSEAAGDIGEYKVAYFLITQANGRSSTMDFRVQVLSGVDISAPVASDYISHYDTLVSNLNSAYDSATSAANKQVAATVSSLASSAAAKLDSALSTVNSINSTANNASSAASKAVSMAASVASAVTSQASYINSVASSAASNVSSVASSAVSNVSSVAATVIDKIDNLSIGGRNLLLDTGRSFTGIGDNSTNGNFHAQGGEYFLAGGKKVSDLYNQYGSTGYLTLSFDWVASGDTISGQFNPQWSGTPWGGLSVKSGAIKPSNTNKSGHYESSVQLNYSGYSTGSALSVIFRQDNLQGNVTISNMKLEAGNVATDWTPAPEDADNTFVKKSGDAMTGALQVGGDARTGKTGSSIGTDGSIELASSTAYIDFHGKNDTADYSSRIYDSGDGLGNKIVDKSGFKILSTPLLASATNKYNLDTVAFGSLVLTGYSHKAIVSTRTNLLGTSPYTSADGVTNILDNVVITWERGFNEKFGVQTITNLWETMTWQRVMREGSWQPWIKVADDKNVVHKTGNETIAGDKTFTNPINGQLAKEPENLFFNSEFENSGEGWGVIAGGATFVVGTGGNDVLGHATVVIKLTGGYAKFGNKKLYRTQGNVNYSLSSLVHVGTATGIYFIVDEFDENKTQIKSTPYGLTSVASWALKTVSFVTQTQTRFVQVTYQVGGSSGQQAYVSAPMWNTGAVPLPYVRGSEMQVVPDDTQLVHKSGDAMTGQLQIGGKAGNGETGTQIRPQGNIELSATTPFIDFHGNNSKGDYTSRLWDTAGGLWLSANGQNNNLTQVLANAANPINIDTMIGGAPSLTGLGQSVRVHIDNLTPDGTLPPGLSKWSVLTHLATNSGTAWQEIWDVVSTSIWRRTRSGSPAKYSAWEKIANDSNVVHKTGNETIAGDKTFTGKIGFSGPVANPVITREVTGTNGMRFTFSRTGNYVHVDISGNYAGTNWTSTSNPSYATELFNVDVPAGFAPDDSEQPVIIEYSSAVGFGRCNYSISSNKMSFTYRGMTGNVTGSKWIVSSVSYTTSDYLP